MQRRSRAARVRADLRSVCDHVRHVVLLMNTVEEMSVRPCKEEYGGVLSSRALSRKIPNVDHERRR